MDSDLTHQTGVVGVDQVDELVILDGGWGPWGEVGPWDGLQVLLKKEEKKEERREARREEKKEDPSPPLG